VTRRQKLDETIASSRRAHMRKRGGVSHEQAVAAAAERSAAAREHLDAVIRDARSAGLPLRTIAKAAGLSPEWVRKIAAD
jgi:hypothetical protein